MSETVKQAIKAGDLGTLGPERLEELGVDVNECLGSEDYTTLHWACHYGRAEVLIRDGYIATEHLSLV